MHELNHSVGRFLELRLRRLRRAPRQTLQRTLRRPTVDTHPHRCLYYVCSGKRNSESTYAHHAWTSIARRDKEGRERRWCAPAASPRPSSAGRCTEGPEVCLAALVASVPVLDGTTGKFVPVLAAPGLFHTTAVCGRRRCTRGVASRHSAAPASAARQQRRLFNTLRCE